MLSYLDFFDYHQKRMAVLEEKYRKEIVELEDRCEALEAIEKKLPDF